MKLNILLALSALFIISSCQNNENKLQSSTTLEMNNYSSDSLHFSIQYPSKWELISDQNTPSTVVFSEPLQDKNDTYQDNLKVWVEVLPFQLPDTMYYQAAMTQIQLANSELKVEKLGMEKIGETNFNHFQFDFTTPDSNQYIVQGYTYMKGKYAYNFTFTSEKHVIANYNSTLHSILETFKTK